MPKRRAYKPLRGKPKKTNSERRLEYLTKRESILTLKKSAMGYHFPTSDQMELDDIQAEAILVKRQITREKSKNPWYRFVKRLKIITNVSGDLLFPHDNAARLRRKRIIRRWKARASGIVFVVAAVGLFGLWQTRSIKGEEPIQLVTEQPISSSSQTVATQEPVQQSPIAALKPATVITPRRIGVLYRIAPNDASVDSANPTGPQEGETVYLLERADQTDGAWWKVQLQDGRVGYIREQFLSFQP